LVKIKRKRNSQEKKDDNRIVDIRFKAIHNAVIRYFGDVPFIVMNGGNKAYYITETTLAIFTSAVEVRERAAILGGKEPWKEIVKKG
jgi:hypothetical protein